MAFPQYVQKQQLSPVELPLIHTTECFRFESIVTSGRLSTSSCPVFGESLLYTFYGRPAYRDTSKHHPVCDISFYPVCFVFTPGTLFRLAKRLFPFDSGASQLGLYEPAISAGNAIRQYELAAAAETARRIVKCFFTVDTGYLSNAPVQGMKFEDGDADVDSYYKLICGGAASECDDRRSAIEVQLGSDLDLGDRILMAIVLPLHYLEDAVLRHTIMTVWGAQPITYFTVSGTRPTEYHMVIGQKVFEFYKDRSLI